MARPLPSDRRVTRVIFHLNHALMHLARSARVVARGSLQSTLRVRPISSGRRALLPLVAAFSSFSFFGMGNGMSSKARTHELAKPALLPPPPGEERIYIAGGCFW